MQGIYTYIPETNYVPREYSVATILLFLFMVLISLVSVLKLSYFYISTFRSMCAVPSTAVFCSSLTSWLPGMLLIFIIIIIIIIIIITIIIKTSCLCVLACRYYEHKMKKVEMNGKYSRKGRYE